MSEDYCPICGRPDGAGHEPKCFVVPVVKNVVCATCNKETNTPWFLTDGVICPTCWKLYVNSQEKGK